MSRTRTEYDLHPDVAVPGGDGVCEVGWEGVGRRLLRAISERAARRTVVVVECYPGVDAVAVSVELARWVCPVATVLTGGLFREPGEIGRLLEPFVGGDDPVFGFMGHVPMERFLDAGKLQQATRGVEQVVAGVVLVVGCGAACVHPGDVLVYADLSRWEAQGRFRRGQSGNLGMSNVGDSAAARYRRAYFVDWRTADRLKRRLMGRWDFVLDTHEAGVPKLVEGGAVRAAFRHAASRPFRVVPFFDPAPWGGQWMKEVCGLDPSVVNYGWCFDGVPEENSLCLRFGNVRVELPSIDLVFAEPRRLLGEAVHGRFGDEFPIRFDLLDTMGGGNLSFQVHPLTEYIQAHFGMHYTQDESYYLLDAGPGAGVYLGLRDGVDREAMGRALAVAQAGGAAFDADRFANRWPARRHDHFLIPAGTVHCSGAESMVLEISATPYIFTFKLWDWGRLGLDGRPRPIHLGHGLENVQWDRTTKWTRRELVNRVEGVGSGAGWREERTGLHEREFIETRRHWFRGTVPHDTAGGVHVLNLVEGREAVVESPDGRFDPFVVHYAETFIVPAAVGRYTVRPHGESAGAEGECATMRASVRTGSS